MNTRPGLLGDVVAAGIAGVAEAMFPENDLGAPDWRATAMVERTLEHVAELPPRMRRQLKLLFVTVELGGGVLGVRLGRFSRLPRERRLALLRRWRYSRVLPLKLLGEALKAELGMIYLSHRAVQMHLGVWKACARPGDPLDLPFIPGRLSGETPDGLVEAAP